MVSEEKKLEMMEGEEQVELSERRTLLSYVRTGLAVVGLGVVAAKIFLDDARWSLLILAVLTIISIVIIAEEFFKLEKDEKNRKEVEDKIIES